MYDFKLDKQMNSIRGDNLFINTNSGIVFCITRDINFSNEDFSIDFNITYYDEQVEDFVNFKTINIPANILTSVNDIYITHKKDSNEVFLYYKYTTRSGSVYLGYDVYNFNTKENIINKNNLINLNNYDIEERVFYVISNDNLDLVMMKNNNRLEYYVVYPGSNTNSGFKIINKDINFFKFEGDTILLFTEDETFELDNFKNELLKVQDDDKYLEIYNQIMNGNKIISFEYELDLFDEYSVIDNGFILNYIYNKEHDTNIYISQVSYYNIYNNFNDTFFYILNSDNLFYKDDYLFNSEFDVNNLSDFSYRFFILNNYIYSYVNRFRSLYVLDKELSSILTDINPKETIDKESLFYGSIEKAELYFQTRNKEAYDYFSELTTEEKESLLLNATTIVDNNNFIGYKKEEDQFKQFPRLYDRKVKLDPPAYEYYFNGGYDIKYHDTITKELDITLIEQATYETAYALSITQSLYSTNEEIEGIQTERFDGIGSFTYFESQALKEKSGYDLMPLVAKMYIKRYLRNNKSRMSIETRLGVQF